MPDQSLERQFRVRRQQNLPFVIFAPTTKEKADLNTLVQHPGLFVLVTQGTAAPGFAQHVIDLGVSQALTLILKLSLCKLVHPDQVNFLVLHTPDSLYQRIASKPAVHQDVINTKPAIDGREKHPQDHLNLVRVQFFHTFSGVRVLDTLATVLLADLLFGHPKRAFLLFPFFPVKTEIQWYGGLTVPVHHHQQLESKHVAVGYMIPYLPDLLYTLPGFRQGGVIEDQVTG